MTVLVSNACFRAVSRARLPKMRRLNIMALIIPPHHGAKIADHSHRFNGRGRNIYINSVILPPDGIHRRLKLLLLMFLSYLISTIVVVGPNIFGMKISCLSG